MVIPDQRGKAHSRRRPQTEGKTPLPALPSGQEGALVPIAICRQERSSRRRHPWAWRSQRRPHLYSMDEPLLPLPSTPLHNWI
ncbi:hypothetical protein E2562_026319 [Oryza meyeriana var. granulata]|uniref:Uncharacterized protein n=1 Tax=Oryza meyeriana var. granulata TaxID=110450 RepID=A0A6G1C8V2_9ORYZ|nr:hypothetical protein E2562_026319 [Oryza meyeriana var. granulata]